MRNSRTHHGALGTGQHHELQVVFGELLDQSAAEAGAADLVAVVVSLGLHLVVNPLHVQAVRFPTGHKD